MKYIGENSIKKLISLIKGDLATKQPTITATGVLERDTTGVINGVETVGATLVETQEATLVDVPNGLLKGDGNTISAAVAGTDYVNSSQAIRYDAAQSLTGAQKTQARGNIAAAPDGFGLGIIDWNKAPESDANKIPGTGWFVARKNVPITPGIWFIRQEFDGPSNNDALQTAWPQNLESYYRGCLAQRYQISGTWSAWEWVNPPLKLGVEYRTTERYMGKPVYIRLEEIAALPNNTTLTVSKVGVPSGGTLYVDNIVDYRAEFYNNSDVYSIPYNDVVDIPECSGSRYGNGIIYSIRTKGVDYSNYAGRIWIKYTKQTN